MVFSFRELNEICWARVCLLCSMTSHYPTLIQAVNHMKLLSLLRSAILLLLLTPASALSDNAGEKVDKGIAGKDKIVAIFVRAKDQLLPIAGDYERFCKEQPKTVERRILRKKIIQTLKQKADRSFDSLRKQVEQLTSDGELKSVQRYWIVNGFACEATAKAAKTLAELDAVGFIYRQRYAPQHKTKPNRGKRKPIEQTKLYRELLEAYQDDTLKPFDASEYEIPWNLKRIRADKAWAGFSSGVNDADATSNTKLQRGYTGRGVTVAVLDSGLMNIPALRPAAWRNMDESLNGKDDDQNGYVDDVFGYNFRGNQPFSIAPSLPPHGSLCAGIIAARPHKRKNKPSIVTGVAPRAKIMPLMGNGHLLAYEYALDNGADVLSMSYTLDSQGLGNYRGLFRMAHEHLSVAGVVSVGGAGNYAMRRPEGWQIGTPKDVPCVIAAAGVTEDGEVSKASSRGPVSWAGVRYYDGDDAPSQLSKPDVTACFGGYPMWTRKDVWKGPKLDRLRVVATDDAGYVLATGPQGNSFSGPHAAGVAALMLDADPDLPVWELKRLMESTCKDLGDPGRDTTFGAGMLQADKAVEAVLARKIQLQR